MSDATYTVGRIALLGIATLLFAAVWHGDEPASARPAMPIAWSRRIAGHFGRTIEGAIADALRRVANATPAHRGCGKLLPLAARTNEGIEKRPLFSGTPALLGRSALTGIIHEQRTTANSPLGVSLE